MSGRVAGYKRCSSERRIECGESSDICEWEVGLEADVEGGKEENADRKGPWAMA